ncbi:MAG TPA: hypothetical protein DCQ26_08305 [Marinilabiliales bacterium]|jgi:hypothetical protein|nr:MAG: hypothetical protein A2W95_10040 [Bacteroidetes bacterium GWA2_40_14]OFX63123.1 MAG: hypothetical protein A2W84_03520 [Bacteroidetes bacterium GWC2_40_13]OFX75731.1 MAG: hypothetical protein A2W96_09185 [Bacteroidetes bacterium GWD2_40_43]OFX94996.1 MAG: hypothetical protein A2W97_16655 [Bacteroidetes bacterium GWE2_40_63]OFY23507.1 MAG: hypothetical protein A2W88_08470 [Bacteroidetes bacterium GWF2_40_13]OFZ29367.1 MAG: hypothetical protein A2437_09130 [Bacteroidetes bacterium RIFOXYC
MSKLKILQTLKYILEVIWLLVALGTLGIAIYENVNRGFQPALPFYLFAAVALFFYSSRHRERVGKSDT